MGSTTLPLGKAGEELAQNFLQSKKFKTIAVNWRYKNHYEIDLLMWSPEDDLVAVEVKTHSEGLLTEPFEKVNKAKVHRLKKALEMYVKNHLSTTPAMRIDVVSVILNDNSIEHFEAVDYRYI